MNHTVKVLNESDVQIGTAVVDDHGKILSRCLDISNPRTDVLMCVSYSTSRDVVVIEPHP